MVDENIEFRQENQTIRTSCGGTLNVVVRRSTLTIVSTQGRIKKRPGPLAPPLNIKHQS